MNLRSLLIDEDKALPGRDESIKISSNHFVNDNRILEPFPDGVRFADFGLGCFWGAERIFWSKQGVYSTAVGYMGGYTKNPTYEEVCSGLTGHTEVVRVFFNPSELSYKSLLQSFWESHNPTQGMRQGNDMGTQYRSAIYTHDNLQEDLALESGLPRFPQDFTCPVVLRKSMKSRLFFKYGAITHYGWFFQTSFF